MSDVSLNPAQRALRLPRSGIREIMTLASGLPDVMHLEVGEPDFGTPAHVVEAAKAAAFNSGRYTPNAGLLSLREAVVAKLKDKNRIDVSVDHVTVTTGGVGAIFSALAAVCDPGDRVLVPDPGWPNYLGMTSVLGLDAVAYPLLPELDFSPDMDRLTSLIQTLGARAIVINTPSNPTGAVWEPHVVAAVVEVAGRHGVFVISDEVYEDIVFEGAHASPAALPNAAHVLSAFSVSKSYAMTGWRVGYLVAPPRISDAVAALQEPTVSCVNGVAQRAAEAAISGPQDCVEQMRAAYKSRRDIAVELVRERGLLVNVPHGAFYLLADISRSTTDSRAFARHAAVCYGVAVAPGDTFGSRAHGMIRLSLAANDTTIRTGISRLAEALAHSNQGGTTP